MRRTTTTVLALLLAACGGRPAVPADLIVFGRVWTGDSARPWAEGIAVAGDSVVAVGSHGDIDRWRGPDTRVLDNGSALVTPGLSDSHTHFIDGGFQLISVDLRDARTPEEFVRRIAAFARTLRPGEWILGGNWDHENWAGAALPSRTWIDSVTPDNPVFVQRLDGHMGVANSAALRAARLTRASRAPAGGEMVRDQRTGDLTGVLKDNAMDAMFAAIPAPSAEQSDSALARAMRYAASVGVTSVHLMSGWSDFATVRRARAAGTRITRIRAYVPLATWRRLADTVAAAGRGDEWLSWGGLKGFMDGSLGSTTAAFYAPYLDAPNTRGLLVNDSADMRRWILAADSAGLQVAVHAIGDRANGMLLDFYEEAIRANGPRDRRFSVEHAQHLREEDIPRFGQMSVVPSMQPYHAIDDGRWAANRLDVARLRGTYAFRTLLDTHARLAFGSDWSVAPLDPIQGIYAAVTRRTLDGRNPEGWFPEQKISLERALRAYTEGVAWSGFQDSRVGVLRPGMLADITLIDRDLFEGPPEGIADAAVRATVVGGRVVYEHP